MVERVRAEVSSWTAEAFRSRVVHERDVAAEEGGVGNRGDGSWWGSLHHRLGDGAWARKEALPEESEGEGERTEVPAARALWSWHVTLLIACCRLLSFLG